MHRFPRVVWACAGAAAVIAAVWSCTGRASSAPPRPVLRVATAFGPFSQPLTAAFQRRLPDLDVRAQTAPGSDAVIAGIEDGSVDLGLSLADVAYAAYWGKVHDTSLPVQSHLRAVLLMQPLSQFLIARAGTGIDRLTDLRGHTVGVSFVQGGSGGTLSMLVLQALGLQSVTVKAFQSRADAAAELANGSVDAIFLPGYTYPDDALHEVVHAGAHLIPIDGPVVEQILQDHPFVRRTTIPRAVFPGQNHIVRTIGINLVVLCRSDLDPSVVQRLTATLLNAYPQLSRVEATLRFLSPDEEPATPIPLHPGAAQYFRERELLR